MNSSTGPTPLLFDWERPLRFRWRLFGLFLLSALAHAGTFFLFQISYPLRVTVPPPAPEVNLLLPITPENRALLRRIEAEDPALVAAATVVQPPALAEAKYRASFHTVRTQPRTVVEQPIAVQSPPAKDPLAIIRSATPPAALATASPPPQPTHVAFTPILAARAPKDAPPWRLSPRATAPLEPTIFLLGITSRGEVRYVFLQHSSGDPALDRQAAAHLPRFDFAGAESPIAWGMATVSWGDDAYGK
jgi:outer membrane biosynthesis protein TonB